MKVADVTIDVIVCLPDDITIIIVRLDRTADVVTDDAVMPVTNYLGCRDIAVTVVKPSDEVLNWFWPSIQIRLNLSVQCCGRSSSS